LPAAMMATAMRGAVDLAIGFNIPRGAGKMLKPGNPRWTEELWNWILSANTLMASAPRITGVKLNPFRHT